MFTFLRRFDAKPLDSWASFIVAWAAFTAQAAIWGGRATISTFARSIDTDPAFCGRDCSAKDGTHLAATAAGVAMGLGPVFGVVAGALTARWGASTLEMLSAVLVALAFILSSYARTPVEFVLAYAPLMGIGSGFMVTPGAVAAGTRFAAKMGLGMGIVYSGGGFGSAVLPKIAGTLLDVMGQSEWRAAQRYIALSAIFGLLAGLFVRARSASAASSMDGSAALLQSEDAVGESESSLEAKGEVVDGTSAVPPPPPSMKTLLLSARYAVSVCTAVLYGYHYYASSYYIVPYARAQGLAGGHYADVHPAIDLEQATSLMLIFGLAQGAGSLILGVLSVRMDKYWLYLVCCVGSAAVNFATPHVHTVAGLGVLAAALGVFSAGARLCFPSMVAEMFLGPLLGAMMGITLMGYGIGALPAPPLSSVIISSGGGSYLVAECVMGGAVFLSGLLAFFGMRRFAPTSTNTTDEPAASDKDVVPV